MIEYIVAIAEHGNISKAANALFITQSGLNQQLIRLEKELNMVLFHRDNHNFAITDAGRIYVENARKLLQIKKDTYTKLQDLNDSTTGNIHLGLTLEHGVDLFTNVFVQFHDSYPGVTFHLKELFVAQQHEAISAGKLDLGVVMLAEKSKRDFQYLKLYEEEMLLGISSSHMLAEKGGMIGTPLPVIDLAMFQNERFALMFPDSTMRVVIDPLFEAAGFQPSILIETAMNHGLIELAQHNCCCTIVPYSRAIAHGYKTALRWFRLAHRPYWTTYIVYKDGAKLSRASKFFIELSQQYGTEQEQLFV